MADTIHPVDLHVGARLREIRKAQRFSQSALAQALGLTFQQVQKYERGTNRISASKLFDAAKVLGVHVSDFYAGLSQVPEGEMDQRPLTADEMSLFAITRQMTPEDLKRLVGIAKAFTR